MINSVVCAEIIIIQEQNADIHKQQDQSAVHVLSVAHTVSIIPVNTVKSHNKQQDQLDNTTPPRKWVFFIPEDMRKNVLPI